MADCSLWTRAGFSHNKIVNIQVPEATIEVAKIVKHLILNAVHCVRVIYSIPIVSLIIVVPDLLRRQQASSEVVAARINDATEGISDIIG